MYTLDTDDLLIVLRSLYFYQDRLSNAADEYLDTTELDRVVWLRTQLGNKLKFEAKID
jgi:hypothetical protein